MCVFYVSKTEFVYSVFVCAYVMCMFCAAYFGNTHHF